MWVPCGKSEGFSESVYLGLDPGFFKYHFLTYKVGVIMIPCLWGYREDLMDNSCFRPCTVSGT
jgi:hypothetical protein